METLEGAGIGRISSAAIEPSVLAVCLLALLPLTFPAWLGKGSVFSTSIDRGISCLLIAVLVLSTSSSAYLGMIILGVVMIPVLVRAKALSVSRAIRIGLAFVALLGGGLVLLITSTPFLSTLFNTLILEKASGGSGVERAMTVQLAFGYFERYPILGIGWGSATSHDLVVLLLSNVGVIGALVFFSAMASALRANWKALGALPSPTNLSRIAWFSGLLLFLLNSLLTGFPLSIGTFWVVLGMALATSSEIQEQEAANLLPVCN